MSSLAIASERTCVPWPGWSPMSVATSRTAGLPLSLLADLKDQIGCVTCRSGATSARGDWFSQGIPRRHEDQRKARLGPELWEQYWDNQPLRPYPERSGDLRSIVTISDFYSARQ